MSDWPLESSARHPSRSSWGDANSPPTEAEIEFSKAISLKRIADALSGAGENIFTKPLNQYGEGIGECIEGQFNRSGR